MVQEEEKRKEEEQARAEQGQAQYKICQLGKLISSDS